MTMQMYVVGGLIVLFGFLLFEGKYRRQSSGNPAAPITENTVTLTSSGFSPQELTIKPGQAVRFKNASLVPASVNSDDYPANRKYPELNLGKFAPNQTLVHVFTKAGKYTYHNQMLPQNVGTIIVK
jgi:plastocyanin